MADLSRIRDIVKAYDIRGVVPDQLDEDIARASAPRSCGCSGPAGS